MPHVKKLVLKGFKSFAKETEIKFSNSMNVIVGPNGSGKSNIADAICFVLGRLSIKSMRAAKAANLIFAGNKAIKPAKLTTVKIFFDNSDKGFNIDRNEVVIERGVKRTGQGVYKVNGETKTRQEVLELLATAGIDPYGFNLVMQGGINEFVKMHAEERRKIIEEVAGISVYEARKQRSLRELEKTDEKLKQVSTILRERTAYLKNLEQERKQALRFKELQMTVKKCKASIIHRKIEDKKKQIKKVQEEIDEKQKQKDKLKDNLLRLQQEIQNSEEKINKINNYVQKSTGLEQEKLHNEITSLREKLAGLSVRKDSSETRLDEIQRRRERAKQDIKNFEKEIAELKKKSPRLAKKQEELNEKKAELEKLEKERKKFYTFKTELNSQRQRINDKQKQLQKTKDENEFLMREIEKLSEGIENKTIESCKKQLSSLREQYESTTEQLSTNESEKIKQERRISVCEAGIKNSEQIKRDVNKLDVCPLCKSKITKEHISHVFSDCDDKIQDLSVKLRQSREAMKKLDISTNESKNKYKNINNEISKVEISIIKLQNIEERKEQMKRLMQSEKTLSAELEELEVANKKLEKKTLEIKNIEEQYDKTLLEVQEISARTEENIDVELEMKARDLEKTRLIIKQIDRDEDELNEEIQELGDKIDELTEKLRDRDKKEKMLTEKYQKLFDQKNAIQDVIKKKNIDMLSIQNNIANVDNIINNFKVDKARVDAEFDNLEIDFNDFKEIELIKQPIPILRDRLEKTQKSLDIIGSVNLKALEVYDEIKKDYDEVAEKVEKVREEKEEIMKIIEEIDKKKKRTFMKALVSINNLFSRNFSQLYTKGQAFLELENREDPFSGGLNITIKIGKGKYFDVTSLSGGEKTLVALSLIFAIQEYKPYCFYLLDEVDAALDKRNSERLATLVKRYMKTGQYIIVTHNDAIITESTTLYGVSMQEGISKILSLEI